MTREIEENTQNMINFINDQRASIYRGIQDTIRIDVGNI